MSGRRLATVPTILALVCTMTPAALADGAGDQQYQDPLTAPSTPHAKKPKAKKQASTTPAATTAPTAGTAPSSSSTAASSTAAQPASARSQLPRTGAPAGLIAMTGAALIGAGVALRRRTAQL